MLSWPDRRGAAAQPSPSLPLSSHPLPVPPTLSTPPSSAPPHPEAQSEILSHSLVTSGLIPADIADLLAEVKFARSQCKVRRNTKKVRILTVEEIVASIKEAEDREARTQVHALVQGDREQQLAVTCALPGGSQRSQCPLGVSVLVLPPPVPQPHHPAPLIPTVLGCLPQATHQLLRASLQS
ncbi:hypothetical protein WMY93_001962 [Mugilogobius chulae]|uniref:Uncharacterized protein n=1 Tax=Mugilogobius chulae TaxID=88201 RepID=A0AAW0PSB3_9GOBI